MLVIEEEPSVLDCRLAVRQMDIAREGECIAVSDRNVGPPMEWRDAKVLREGIQGVDRSSLQTQSVRSLLDGHHTHPIRSDQYQGLLNALQRCGDHTPFV